MAELNNVEKKAWKILKLRKPKTLEEAVSTLVSEGKYDFDLASKTVYFLWKKGYIDLKPRKHFVSFFQYLFSIESLWFWLLSGVIVVTLTLALTVTKPPLVYLRYFLGSIFVLYIPGATFIEALYPRGVELEGLERLALSIGLSLALVPLVGLVLNYTPWGIRLVPITVSLALLSELLAIVALWRKYAYFIIS